MKYTVSAVLFAALVSYSCSKNEAKATYIEGVGTTSPGNTAQAKNSASSMLLPAATAAPPVTAPVNSSAGGTNPPHGQPGHRCDIAVGAPLNSAPSASTATPAQQITTSPPSATTAPAVKTKTAAGMNPPHGEPGHRCDIAVGAPLNSPAKTQPSTASSAPVSVPQPAASADNSTALAMNPPHGEPGHRCDIAVGAPLK